MSMEQILMQTIKEVINMPCEKGKKGKKYYIIIEHAESGGLFSGGHSVGAVYKLNVKKK